MCAGLLADQHLAGEAALLAHLLLDAHRDRDYSAARFQPLEELTLAETASLANRLLLRATVRTALLALPRSQRQALELAYFAGLSHREIAAQQGIPLPPVLVA